MSIVTFQLPMGVRDNEVFSRIKSKRHVNFQKAIDSISGKTLDVFHQFSNTHNLPYIFAVQQLKNGELELSDGINWYERRTIDYHYRFSEKNRVNFVWFMIYPKDQNLSKDNASNQEIEAFPVLEYYSNREMNDRLLVDLVIEASNPESRCLAYNQNLLANMIEDENIIESIFWRRKAAENGSLSAQMSLGYTLLKGERCHLKDKEAFFWFHQAAEQGSLQGQFLFANMLRKGVGCERNLRKAILLLRKMIFQGDDALENAPTQALIDTTDDVISGKYDSFESDNALQGFYDEMIFSGDYKVPKENEEDFDFFMDNYVKRYYPLTPALQDILAQSAKAVQLRGDALDDSFEDAVVAGNMELAQVFIDLNNGVIPFLNYYIDLAIEERNLELVELLIANNKTEAFDQLIEKCTDANLEFFLEDILTAAKMTLKEEETALFSQKAFSQGNLSMMRFFELESWQDTALKLLQDIPECLILRKFIQLSLNSNISDVMKLLTLVRERSMISLEEVDQIFGIIERCCVIARVPNPFEQEVIWKIYGENKKFENYLEQQLSYSKMRYDQVEKVVQEIKRDSLNSLDSVYLQLCDKTWRIKVHSTPILQRYSSFKKDALKKIEQSVKGSLSNVKKKSRNYAQVTYTDVHGNSFPLTLILPHEDKKGTFLKLQHTAPSGSNESDWLNRIGLSEDWSQILKMKVNAKDPLSIVKFKEMVATFYWKGAHLMPVGRGNAQTMLELHAILYLYHSLKAPVPSRKIVFPDCVALCCTLDEFIERYESCWEFIPDTLSSTLSHK